MDRKWSGKRIGNYNPKPTIRASLSEVIGFSKTQQSQIKNIAETGVRAALDLDIPVFAFLAILQQESHFGMYKSSEGPRKNSTSNPSQFSSGRARVSTTAADYQFVLQYNIEQSIIQVYRWAERMAAREKGNKLWWTFYYWNGNTNIGKNGKEQRVNFADATLAYARSIKSSMRVERSKFSFWSFGILNAPPVRSGLKECKLFLPC